MGVTLLKTSVTENPLFCHFALPNSDTGEMECEEWTRNPVAAATHQAMKKAGRADQSLRVQLVLLLLMHPPKWIAQHFPGVGRITTNHAKVRAIVSQEPGSRKISKPTMRSRLVSEKEEHFVKWTALKDSVESSPSLIGVHPRNC